MTPVPDGFLIASAYVKVSPDTDGFAEQLQADIEEATAGAEGKVRIGADDAELDAALDDAKAKLDELDGKTGTVTLAADDGDLSAKLDDAKADVDELDGKTATAKLGLDKDQFDEDLGDANADLDAFHGQQAEASLLLDKSQFDAEMDDAEARLAAFNAAVRQRPPGRVRRAGGAAAGGGESVEGSMLGAAVLGGGMLSPGIGGAAMGLGLLAGTGALAFGGIARALSAAHQSSDSTGMTGARLAAQNYGNTVQNQQARQAVTQAREQAAQDAITSDQSIQQADMNLASAQRNAAASQVQALQSVDQARQGVEQATYSLSQANYQLSQSYIQAREQIVSANDALADSKLNVQSATLAVAQAEYNLTEVNQNAYSTDLQREQAALAVAQAKQQVKDATDQEKDAQVAATQADQQGVDGSQAVIQARQAQLAATEQLKDAQESYRIAQMTLRDTELNNAQQVKAAEMQAAQAREQAAYQRKMDAQSIADAERNVTETVKEQRLQMAAMMSTSNSAANQFAKDMAGLTPAGRHFVDQVLSMKGAFKGLEGAAQNAVLPGFTGWLRGIAHLAPEIKKGVSEMGGAMSNAFSGFGKQLDSPGAVKTMQGLVSNGLQFANIVLPAFAGFAGALAQLGSKQGAVTGLADILAGIGHGLTGFASALGPSIPAFDQLGEALGKIAAAMGPALGRDIGLVAQLLRPVAALLNSKIGGPFIGGLAQAGAALLIFKGAIKLLPDFISKPLAEAAGKLGGWLASPLKKLGGQLQTWGKQALGTLTGWAKQAGSAISEWASNAGTAISGWASNAGTAISGWASDGWTAVSGWASKAGTAISGWATQGVSSVATFVTSMGSRLAEAATATGAWIAENTAAAATYIGSNIAMAASATAAFIAENAATLGLGAVLALLVTGIVYLATHWKQSWNDMKDVVLDVYYDGIEPLGGWMMDAFRPVENAALWLWHDVFDPMWHGIESGAKSLVSGLRSAWGDIETVFKTPVNFLINTVYDHGVRGFWNEIVGKVGLSGLDLPYIAPLARGGMLPGYAPGHDTVPAMLSPGEAVLTPGAARAIGGKPAVDALNAAHQPTSGASGSAGHFAGGSGDVGGMAGKELAKQLRKHLLERTAEHGLTLGKFAGGGIVGDITGGISSAWDATTSAVSGLWDTGKAVAALATGNTTALINALGPILGTSASGDLAKIMLGIPKTLLGDMVHLVSGLLGGGSGGGTSSGTAGSLPQNWHTIASYLASHGFTKYAAAGVAGNIEAESGGLPEQLEIGGGGGGGLIQWTPWQSYGPLITGNATQDLMTQLAAILTFGGGPSIVNRATSPSDAATIYQNYYEKPKNRTASLPIRTASANAVYEAMWGGGASAAHSSGVGARFDSGGWLMPSTVPVNQTGRPEAVLTPEQSDAFLAVANRMIAQGGATATGQAPVISLNFYGPQMPSQEQLAEMYRQLSLAAG